MLLEPSENTCTYTVFLLDRTVTNSRFSRVDNDISVSIPSIKLFILEVSK